MESKTPESYTAVRRKSSVVVPAQRESNTLYQNGYGTQLAEEGVLTLTPCETLYLVETGRLSVLSEETRQPLSFSDLLLSFTPADKLIWTRYLVFRDLRSKGLVVRPGYDQGIDFLVYARGDFGKRPPKYLIYAIWEGEPKTMDELVELVKLAQQREKEVRIAVIDRRGEIVHYSLQELNLAEVKDLTDGEEARDPRQTEP